MSSTPDTIGLISWDYDSPKGGMGISLRMIVRQLRDARLTVQVFSPSPEHGGQPLLRLTRRWGGHMLFSLLLPCRVRRVLRRSGVRHLLVPVGPGGVFLLRRPPVPVTAIVYHTYLQQARAVPGQHWKRIFLPFERRTLRMAGRVLCFSADTQRVLIEDYGIRHAVLLPHAVERAEPAARKDDAHVVCVARLEARKGVDVLLAAWPRILARMPHARLTMVGRGKNERATDRRIAALRGVTRVHGLSHDALHTLVARATVAVCPAYLEGFGLAAAEAMAAGTAVIASDADGLRSLIAHGRTGLLVPAGGGEVLAHAVTAVLSDSALRERMARAAQEEMHIRHDAAACARAFVDAVTALA